MNIAELISYTEQSLLKSGLKLSDLSKSEMTKRYNKSENDGGYSSYWKNTSLEDANIKRCLRVQSVSNENNNRIIVWG